MTDLRYNETKVREYREVGQRLHELRVEVQERIQSAGAEGALHKAEDALAELKASGKEFEKLRLDLAPTDLFVVKYSIEVHGPHEISFVVPRGVSRYEMVCEGRSLLENGKGSRPVIDPRTTRMLLTAPISLVRAAAPEYVRIVGHVIGGAHKTKAEQEELLAEKGLTQATPADVAAAYVAHRMAACGHLFGWLDVDLGISFDVRVDGGALKDTVFGLVFTNLGDDWRKSSAVAARIT